MSPNPLADQPDQYAPRRTLLKTLANIGVFCVFVVGAGVAASSFGLFGCWCTEGFTRREKPAEIVPAPETPAKIGELPVSISRPNK